MCLLFILQFVRGNEFLRVYDDSLHVEVIGLSIKCVYAR